MACGVWTGPQGTLTGFTAAHFDPKKLILTKVHFLTVDLKMFSLFSIVDEEMHQRIICAFLLVNSSRFLEVKNQEAKSDSFPYKFTVCLSTMFDFINVLQVTSLDGS